MFSKTLKSSENNKKEKQTLIFDFNRIFNYRSDEMDLDENKSESETTEDIEYANILRKSSSSTKSNNIQLSKNDQSISLN